MADAKAWFFELSSSFCLLLEFPLHLQKPRLFSRPYFRNPVAFSRHRFVGRNHLPAFLPVGVYFEKPLARYHCRRHLHF